MAYRKGGGMSYVEKKDLLKLMVLDSYMRQKFLRPVVSMESMMEEFRNCGSDMMINFFPGIISKVVLSIMIVVGI